MIQRLRALTTGPGRGAAILSIGTVASGVLAYAFNAVAARALGPDAYGPVAILWAAVFLVSVVLFRPVEQTVSREVADRLARGVDPRPVVRSAVRVASILCGGALAVCLVLAGPITDVLFDGHAVLTAALAAGIAGYAASYLARGVLGGMRWFSGYGVLLLADGAARLLLVAPLLVVASTTVAGIAVAGAAIAGALAPLAVGGLRRTRMVLTARRPPESFAVGDVAAFAGPVMVVAAADQVLVSGGPLLVVLHGGADATTAAGTVFAATMLVRAPVFLFQGLAAALLPSLTTFRAQGDSDKFRAAVARTTAVLAVFGAVLACGALLAGPMAMRLLYGPGFDAGRGDLALLAVGVGCYLAASTFSQAALALGAAVRAAMVWTCSAVVFVGLELTLAGSALHRVSAAFAVATAIGAVLALLLAVRGGQVAERERERSPLRGASPGWAES
jgi:O-antigen/teichoic acid export membrane protein